MSAEITATEMFESLNGFEEIAIKVNFGMTLSQVREDPTLFLRALAFVDLKRGGQKDGEAKSVAMSMPLKDTLTYFAEDEDDLIPEEPDSESGKDVSPPE